MASFVALPAFMHYTNDSLVSLEALLNFLKSSIGPCLPMAERRDDPGLRIVMSSLIFKSLHLIAQTSVSMASAT